MKSILSWHRMSLILTHALHASYKRITDLRETEYAVGRHKQPERIVLHGGHYISYVSPGYLSTARQKEIKIPGATNR